jgi:hypothetical protein
MCTMIVEKVKIDGSGKGMHGWFKLEQANVSYDHPFNAPLEHALNIDCERIIWAFRAYRGGAK